MEQCGHVEAKRDSVVVSSTKLKTRTFSRVKTAGRLFSRGGNQPATHSPWRRELAKFSMPLKTGQFLRMHTSSSHSP